MFVFTFFFDFVVAIFVSLFKVNGSIVFLDDDEILHYKVPPYLVSGFSASASTCGAHSSLKGL